MNDRPAPSRSATILDVAREAGVSKSTVSLVLQASPLIRAETADRVRDAARRVGYVYNRRAAQLRHQRSNVVGVVINDLMNPFFAEVLVGIEAELAQAGYVTFMAHTQEDVERQQQVLHSMREQHVAGLIVCPALGTPPTLVEQVRSWGIPLVVLVRSLGAGEYDFAGSDNASGTRLATRHLLDAGHRAVGFLGGPSGAVAGEREAGWRAALAERGITPDHGWAQADRPTRQGGHAAMRRLLASAPQVRAAVCYSDIVAMGALAALGEAGLAAGRDFAIVGFDGVLDAAHANPPLTTVDIQPTRLGRAAAATLLRRLESPEAPRAVHLAEPVLLSRQSA